MDKQHTYYTQTKLKKNKRPVYYMQTTHNDLSELVGLYVEMV